MKSFGFDREKLLPITEELANLWEITYYHRELRPGVRELLDGRKDVGIPIAASEKPDVVIQNFGEFPAWLDRENPTMALK